MDFFVMVLLLLLGFIFIIKGGDFFVDASVWIAEVLHMPKFLIGATIVSLATTLPELIVSVISTVGNNYAFALGNAIGSVTANTGLILAISAIFVSARINRKDFIVKAILIIVSTSILLGFCLTGKFGILPSILLCLVFIFYMYDTIKSAKRSNSELQTEENDSANEDKKEVDKSRKGIIINIIKFIVGGVGIVAGAYLLKDNAEALARKVGVSDEIIAITILAIGTSLPELVTTIISIVKKQGELGVGNVIGANIIDLVLILPICSIISGGNLTVNAQSRFLDIPVCLAISTVAVVPTYIFKKFNRWQGVLMIIMYVAYLLVAAFLGPVLFK